MLTSTLGQLPCKIKSCHLLTCILRQLPCTMQKHMTTRVKRVDICLQAKLGQLPYTCRNTWQLPALGVGEVINVHTPAPSACVKLVCGRIAKRPHTSPPCGEKRTCGRPDECPHTSLVLRGTQKLLERAKIRAELVGRGSMRVGELPDAHTCGR